MFMFVWAYPTHHPERMFLLVPAHPCCPRQNPQSCKTVVCVCSCLWIDVEFAH